MVDFPDMNTAQTFLALAPSFVALIQALENLIPQKGAGAAKLKAFTDIAALTVNAGAPLASQGLSGPHDPATITALATQFAGTVVGAMNAAKAGTVASALPSA